MRKALLTFLAGCLCLAFLTACGSGQQAGATSSSIEAHGRDTIGSDMLPVRYANEIDYLKAIGEKGALDYLTECYLQPILPCIYQSWDSPAELPQENLLEFYWYNIISQNKTAFENSYNTEKGVYNIPAQVLEGGIGSYFTAISQNFRGVGGAYEEGSGSYLVPAAEINSQQTLKITALGTEGQEVHIYFSLQWAGEESAATPPAKGLLVLRQGGDGVLRYAACTVEGADAYVPATSSDTAESQSGAAAPSGENAGGAGQTPGGPLEWY